jgi:hypothetical protein
MLKGGLNHNLAFNIAFYLFLTKPLCLYSLCGSITTAKEPLAEGVTSCDYLEIRLSSGLSERVPPRVKSDKGDSF